MRLSERYRPKTWAEVVGQDAALALINRWRRAGLGGSPYLLAGKSGTGKTTIARLMAAELAPELAIQEDNAADVTTGDVSEFERRIRGRCLPDASGKTGHAWILNECHLLKNSVVSRFLTTLEDLPAHAVVIFTTSKEIQANLLDEYADGVPFVDRCRVVRLAQANLATAGRGPDGKRLPGPFALRARQIAVEAGLDGKPIEDYVRLVNDCGGSLRAAIQRIEDGVMCG